MDLSLLSAILLLRFLTEAALDQVRPQAVVTIKPDRHVPRGVDVTLHCEMVGGGDTLWEYEWYKNSLPTVVSTGQEYALGFVNVNHTGAYICSGINESGKNESEYNATLSSAVILTVSGESQPASLSITPSRTQHFSADSLTLSCEGLSNSAEWGVRRYTDSEMVSDCPSGWGSVTGSKCHISNLTTQDTGVYWCQSASGGSSSAVNIIVHSGSVILESPVHPLTEGESLTLKCLFRDTHTQHDRISAAFYKNESLIQTGEEIKISTVSESDEGLYYCKSKQGESPKGRISVKAGNSSTGLVRLAVGLGFGLLFLTCCCSLILRCYTAKKGSGNIDCAVAQAEKSETDDCVAGPGDVIYSEVMKKRQPIKKDAISGPSDVIYVEVELIPKKGKRTHDEASVNAGCLYSELKYKLRGELSQRRHKKGNASLSKDGTGFSL